MTTRTATPQRCALGIMLGVLVEAHDALDNDPISRELCYYPDEAPVLRSLIAKHGWTIASLRDAIIAQTSDGHRRYMLLSLVPDEAQPTAPRFRGNWNDQPTTSEE